MSAQRAGRSGRGRREAVDGSSDWALTTGSAGRCRRACRRASRRAGVVLGEVVAGRRELLVCPRARSAESRRRHAGSTFRNVNLTKWRPLMSIECWLVRRVASVVALTLAALLLVAPGASAKRALIAFIPTQPAPKVPLLFDLEQRDFAYGLTSPSVGSGNARWCWT